MKYIKKENSDYIKNKGDVLACNYYHPFACPEGRCAIGDCGAFKIDDKEWDVFHVHYETKDTYYGIPMLGMGLVDCMVLKSDTRLFTKEEIEYFNGKTLGMSGSHTCKASPISWKLEIEPVTDLISK